MNRLKKCENWETCLNEHVVKNDVHFCWTGSKREYVSADDVARTFGVPGNMIGGDSVRTFQNAQDQADAANKALTKSFEGVARAVGKAAQTLGDQMRKFGSAAVPQTTDALQDVLRDEMLREASAKLDKKILWGDQETIDRNKYFDGAVLDASTRVGPPIAPLAGMPVVTSTLLPPGKAIAVNWDAVQKGLDGLDPKKMMILPKDMEVKIAPLIKDEEAFRREVQGAWTDGPMKDVYTAVKAVQENIAPNPAMAVQDRVRRAITSAKATGARVTMVRVAQDVFEEMVTSKDNNGNYVIPEGTVFTGFKVFGEPIEIDASLNDGDIVVDTDRVPKANKVTEALRPFDTALTKVIEQLPKGNIIHAVVISKNIYRLITDAQGQPYHQDIPREWYVNGLVPSATNHSFFWYRGHMTFVSEEFASHTFAIHHFPATVDISSLSMMIAVGDITDGAAAIAKEPKTPKRMPRRRPTTNESKEDNGQ